MKKYLFLYIFFWFLWLGTNTAFASSFSIYPNNADNETRLVSYNCSIDNDYQILFFNENNLMWSIDNCDSVNDWVGMYISDWLGTGSNGDNVVAIVGTQDLSVSTLDDALSSQFFVENLGVIYTYSDNYFILNNGIFFNKDNITGEKTELNNLLASVGTSSSRTFASLGPILAVVGGIILAFGVLLEIIYWIYDAKSDKKRDNL